MRVVVFAGKREADCEYMREHLLLEDYIIACDAGLDTIDKLGLKPDILIGDFDSVDILTLDKYEGIERLTYAKDKDFSDLDLTFQYCKDLKTTEIIVFGAIGGRVDHSLSNVELLKTYSDLGLDIKLYDFGNEMFITKRSIAIKKTRTYLSLIPITKECIVSLKGVLFEMDHRKIDGFPTLTISNEIKGNFAFLDIHNGAVLVIQSDPYNLS